MDAHEGESNGVQITTPVQQWRSARAQLASAIQAFSTASASLQTSDFAIASPTLGHPDLSLDKLDVEEELQALATETRRLGDACTLLKVKRNDFQRVVPINRLSEDILARIFATIAQSQEKRLSTRSPNQQAFRRYFGTYLCHRYCMG
ncbi:hypothetical protein RSAG8_02408, partial [Rhizoctonia solani AG-8 WAC10335]